ncbi:unnamed protein product [Calypogeia fissa]
MKVMLCRMLQNIEPTRTRRAKQRANELRAIEVCTGKPQRGRQEKTRKERANEDQQSKPDSPISATTSRQANFAMTSRRSAQRRADATTSRCNDEQMQRRTDEQTNEQTYEQTDEETSEQRNEVSRCFSKAAAKNEAERATSRDPRNKSTNQPNATLQCACCPSSHTVRSALTAFDFLSPDRSRPYKVNRCPFGGSIGGFCKGPG